MAHWTLSWKGAATDYDGSLPAVTSTDGQQSAKGRAAAHVIADLVATVGDVMVGVSAHEDEGQLILNISKAQHDAIAQELHKQQPVNLQSVPLTTSSAEGDQEASPPVETSSATGRYRDSSVSGATSPHHDAPASATASVSPPR